MLKYVGHGLVRAFMALTAFNLATILAPLAAMADPLDVSAGQEAAGGQETAPDSTRENNGFDITRPQTAFEVRGLDQTSSNETSKTNKAEALLRVESKIPLDADWRLGLLAQVPLVGKTTTDFEPPSVNHVFGLGDVVFQAFVAHNIDERWAVGACERANRGRRPWQR
jgi:hypothetical protein